MRIRKTFNEDSPKVIKEKYKSNIHYNPETGELKSNITGHVYTKTATKGYISNICLSFNNVEYSAASARLCWFLYYGKFVPKGLQIDHINNIKTDNRISNLQLVSNSINSYKRTLIRDNNKSGFKGVSYDATKGYVAVIGKDKKIIKIGMFINNKELAAKFYDAANRYLFKDMANPNFKEIWIPPVDITTLRKILKNLKATVPYLSETEGLKEKLGELLESYGYPNIYGNYANQQPS